MNFLLLLPILSHLFFVTGETKLIGHLQQRWTTFKSHTIIQRRTISTSKRITKRDQACNGVPQRKNKPLMGNMAVCQALGGGTMVGDVSDCQAVAYFMATQGVPCAMFRSCAVMTRDSDDDPQALIQASPEEAMYCIGNHISKHCQVQTPFPPRQGSFSSSQNDDLTITFLFFNMLENSPSPQACDAEVFNALKDSPS